MSIASQWPWTRDLKDKSAPFSLLTTCLVLATKYYEEKDFVNVDKYIYTHDSHFYVATLIPTNTLYECQVVILQQIDYRLYISEEEFKTYTEEIINLAKLLSRTRDAAGAWLGHSSSTASMMALSSSTVSTAHSSFI